ncbi:MAG: hypothetical protein IJL09_10420 [Lachnospiraceae bacterium]|nr:hypothetical protein [Lachnospiraceae bacterium]
MRRGNVKKRVLKEIVVSIILSVALCGCSFSVGEPTEQNPTETVTKSSTPEVVKDSADLHKEEFPFESMESMNCQEYDEENILGLSAIYIGEHDLVFCFACNTIWRGFKESSSEISIYGVDEQGLIMPILGHEIKKSTSYFWVRIYAEQMDEVKGVGITNSHYGYSVQGLESPRLTIQEAQYLKFKSQLLENDHWGEVVDYEVSPIHQPD